MKKSIQILEYTHKNFHKNLEFTHENFHENLESSYKNSQGNSQQSKKGNFYQCSTLEYRRGIPTKFSYFSSLTEIRAIDHTKHQFSHKNTNPFTPHLTT